MNTETDGSRGSLVPRPAVEAACSHLMQHFKVQINQSQLEQLLSPADNPAFPAAWQSAQQADFVYTFEASQPITIASGSSNKVCTILSTQIEPRLLHLIYPHENECAYRSVELISPFDAPLLNGPLDVYCDREFLLTTQLDNSAAKSKLRLCLGVEQAIRVQRHTDFKEEHAGIISGSSILCHEIVTKVINGLGRPIEFELHERLPRPRQRPAQTDQDQNR